MSSIITHSGKLVDVHTPLKGSIDISDIAHALSNLCRWGGHCREFYSVAQHSVIVSRHVAESAALYGLLHDAAEAYLVDLPRPIKQRMPEYGKVEAGLQTMILGRFGLHGEIPEDVHYVDNRLMFAESMELGMHPQLWAIPLPVPLPVVITPWSPAEAKRRFLERFAELCPAGEA